MSQKTTITFFVQREEIGRGWKDYMEHPTDQGAVRNTSAQRAQDSKTRFRSVRRKTVTKITDEVMS